MSNYFHPAEDNEEPTICPTCGEVDCPCEDPENCDCKNKEKSDE